MATLRSKATSYTRNFSAHAIAQETLFHASHNIFYYLISHCIATIISNAMS